MAVAGRREELACAVRPPDSARHRRAGRDRDRSGRHRHAVHRHEPASYSTSTRRSLQVDGWGRELRPVRFRLPGWERGERPAVLLPMDQCRSGRSSELGGRVPRLDERCVPLHRRRAELEAGHRPVGRHDVAGPRCHLIGCGAGSLRGRVRVGRVPIGRRRPVLDAHPEHYDARGRWQTRWRWHQSRCGRPCTTDEPTESLWHQGALRVDGWQRDGTGSRWVVSEHRCRGYLVGPCRHWHARQHAGWVQLPFRGRPGVTGRWGQGHRVLWRGRAGLVEELGHVVYRNPERARRHPLMGVRSRSTRHSIERVSGMRWRHFPFRPDGRSQDDLVTPEQGRPADRPVLQPDGEA